MVVAVVVVVGAALLFLVVFGGPGSGSSDGDQADKSPERQRQVERGKADTSGGGEPVAPVVPLPSELPVNPPRVATRARQAAERVGRKFAASYLLFQRRKVKVSEIAGAAPGVRRQIARAPRGRVSPAAAENPPKVVAVASQVVNRDTIVVTATVSRLGAKFPLRMTAERGRSGWAITALQAEN